MNISDNDKVIVRVAVAVGSHILDVKDTGLVSPNNARFFDVLLLLLFIKQ